MLNKPIDNRLEQSNSIIEENAIVEDKTTATWDEHGSDHRIPASAQHFPRVLIFFGNVKPEEEKHKKEYYDRNWYVWDVRGLAVIVDELCETGQQCGSGYVTQRGSDWGRDVVWVTKSINRLAKRAQL